MFSSSLIGTPYPPSNGSGDVALDANHDQGRLLTRRGVTSAFSNSKISVTSLTTIAKHPEIDASYRGAFATQPIHAPNGSLLNV